MPTRGDAPSATQLAPDGLPEASDDLLPRPRDVLVAQRAVAGAEGQAQRERDAALPDLGPAVDVEDLRALEQPAAGLPDDGEDRLGRDVVADDHGQVLQDGGEAREVAVGRDLV